MVSTTELTKKNVEEEVRYLSVKELKYREYNVIFLELEC